MTATTRLARTGLWAHKRRLAGTFAAVFLGVAFLAGTLMLGDTLQRNFESLFSEVTSGTDAVVRGPATLSDEIDERPPIPASTLTDVRAVDGVAAAAVSIEGTGALIDRDGEKIGGNGPPTLAGNWVADPDLNAYRIASGRPPRADDEVVVNRGAAEAGSFAVGDTVTVQAPEPVRVRIVGIATFGDDADGLGTTTFTAFTTAGAERHVTKQPGEVSSILVKGEDGVTQDAIVARLRSALGSSVQVVTGAQLTVDRVTEVDETFLDGLRTVLVVFAAIALVVAAFSIRNTFAIVAAQRMRESALLRAIGATRGQVLGATLLETFAVGAVASLAGLAGGIAIATGLKGMFSALGFALPAGGLDVTVASASVAVVVGIVVTVLAGLAPARAAARVAPIAALRDAALDGPSTATDRGTSGSTSNRRTTTGTSSLRAGLGRGGRGRRAGGRGFARVVAAAVRVVGAPVTRLGGAVGALAQRNAMRNPRRTFGAASALLVGVTVVTAFTVVGASLKASLDASAEQGVRSDLVIDGGEWDEGSLPPALATETARLPQVRTAVGLGVGQARIGGASETVRIAAPAALTRVVDLGIERSESGRGDTGGASTPSSNGTSSGSAASGGAASGSGAPAATAPDPSATPSLAPLEASRSIAVSRDAADEHDWTVGSRAEVTFPDGAEQDLTINAIYTETGIAGDYLLPRAVWQGHARQDADATVFVTLVPGTGEAEGKQAVETAAQRWGSPATQTRSEYVESAGDQVNMILAIVYVLLALAVLIALLGIANALSLAAHERTRELGLLRAVGQTRGQLRAMVRYEAVVVALLGTLGGLLLGVPLAWLLTQLAGEIGIDRFSIPVAQLAIVLVVGALAGVLAAVRPARRVARLDVLRAIATE